MSRGCSLPRAVEAELKKWQVFQFVRTSLHQETFQVHFYLRNEHDIDDLCEMLHVDPSAVTFHYKQSSLWQTQYLEQYYAESFAQHKRQVTTTPRLNLQQSSSTIVSNYNSYINTQQLSILVQNLTLSCPSLFTFVSSIGKSVQNRDIWAIKLSTSNSVLTGLAHKPAIRLVGNMHGDETVGRQMLIYLLDTICREYDSTVNGDTLVKTSSTSIRERISRILQKTDVYLVPSMNPDGFELAQRENANNIDLNRNFPDQFIDPNPDTLTGRQVETRLMMQWTRTLNTQTPVVLAANLHGGALVASYPYDGSSSRQDVYTKAPDDTLFKHLARTYANNHLSMYSSPSFPQGITNGAAWYALYGGLQDYSYVYQNTPEVTLELSDIKYPAANTLSFYWNENKMALIAYMEQAFTIGIKGIVYNADTLEPLNATISVPGISAVKSRDNLGGVYYKLLVPGANYTVTATATGYQTVTRQVSLPANQDKVEIVSFAMKPNPSTPSNPNSGGNSTRWLNPVWQLPCILLLLTIFV